MNNLPKLFHDMGCISFILDLLYIDNLKKKRLYLKALLMTGYIKQLVQPIFSQVSLSIT